MGTATGADLTDLDDFVRYRPMLIYRGSLNSWDAAFRTIVRRRLAARKSEGVAFRAARRRTK
jgi:hypothetical protein